jgi:phosphatidylinositol alpha-1,6-mannosyltransferase
MLEGVRRTLIVTNDFPPRVGGIQSFIHSVSVRQPEGSVVVYASDHPGAAAFDADQPFPVIRHPTGLLLPTPSARRRIVAALVKHRCTAVWFGAAAPLGLLAPHLRRAGAERIVASTHGHEIGWVMLPVGRQAMRRIGSGCDVMTYLGEYTHGRLTRALGTAATLRRLAPGVDTQQFHPGVDGKAVRTRYGLDDRAVIVCVSRLVPRKGQDVLIRALPRIRQQAPDAALLLVGRPNRARFLRWLQLLAAREGVADHVIFAGGVPGDQLAEYYAAGDLFAMPCRTRRLGLDVEGLGIVYLEASAVARAVIAGESGGAPEAVREGESGYVVNGRDPTAVAAQIVGLLADAAERERLGRAGRRWVEQAWTWDVAAAQLHSLLQG